MEHEKKLEQRIDRTEIAFGLAGGFVGWICSIPFISLFMYLLSGFEQASIVGFIRTMLGFAMAYGFCHLGFFFARDRYRKSKSK